MLNNVPLSPDSTSIIYKLTTPVTYSTNGVTFICLLTGSAKIAFNDNTYDITDKDILFLRPGPIYHLESDISALIMELTFEYISFKAAFPIKYDYIKCNSVIQKNLDYTGLRTHIAQLALVHYTNLEQNQYYLLSNTYKFFHYIENDFLPSIINKTPKDKYQLKLEYIIEYIKKNYMTSVSLNDLAYHMDITPQYLAKFIKQHLSVTFMEYLNNVRLEESCNYLKFTEKSQSDIAQLCGFSTKKVFTEKFETKFLQSPNTYRHSFKKTMQGTNLKDEALIVEPSLAKDYIMNNIHLVSQTTSIAEITEKKNSVISVANSKPLKKTWMKMINIGYSFNFRNPSFRKHIQILQSELSFEYGRLQGILDLIDIYKSENNTSYNFIQVFNIIDFLLSVNIRPMLELGSKSLTIYKDDFNLSYQEDSKRSYARLKKLLSVFLENCINRYGINEVSKWKFELWMEYNANISIVEMPSEYVKRFKFVYTVIKSILPSAEVGGPGFNTFVDLQHLVDVVKELYANHLQPDFVSYYLYPYTKRYSTNNNHSNFYILSKDKNIYKKYSRQIKAMVNKYLSADTELYVTEYSSFITSHNYINDSNYVAAFIIKEVMDNWEYANMLGYWLVSDISIQFEDTPEILFGGNGLLTRSGIKKSGYYAYFFLKQLGTSLICKDKNYIITTDANRRFQILAFHYGYFNEQYCENQSTYKLLRYPSSAFESLAPLELTLVLNCVPSGTYTIRKHTISQRYGNILHNWLKLDTPKELAKKDIDYFKNVSVPNVTITKKEITDTLELSCQLNLNDVIFYEIDLWLS